MHQGHRDRLRQRYKENNLDGFADHEILELLLSYAIPRKDVNPLAHQLIDHFGGLGNVLYADIDDLCQVKGVGEHTAVLLTLLPKVMQNVQIQQMGERPMLSTPEEAVKYLKQLFIGRKTEAFYVLLLDNQHRLLHAEKISEGSHCEATVEPRSVVQSCLKSGAAAVILAHNHPGGSVRPSSDDLRVTEELEKALSYINVDCIDHIIIAQESSYGIRSKRSVSMDGAGQAAPRGVASRQSVVDPHQLAMLLHNLDQVTLDVVLAEMNELERRNWGAE